MKEKISRAILTAEQVINKVWERIVHFLFSLIWALLWLPVSCKIACEKSYFPECERKPFMKRLIENIWWTLKYRRGNGFYSLYGLDVKGASSKDYIDETQFWKGLTALNYCRGVSSQVCLLRDKLLFFKYMKQNGMPVPEVFGVIKNGRLFDEELYERSWDTLTNEVDYYLKDIDGECASFVKHIHDYQELVSIVEKVKEGTYILQRRIIQSKEMSVINPKAVNTLRIVTLFNNGKPKVLSAVLRVGTSASGNVDNWAAGGLAIGILDDGYLKKYGFYKPASGGGKQKIHSDTGVIFEQYKVPMFEEAKQIACDAHRCFYNIGAIGWDIAISEDGPVFVEGNDNFEITLMQACDRPLKADWLDAVKQKGELD